jgi:hypothetical protein
VFCNDDISNIFGVGGVGSVAPFPGLRTRTSNPSRFRNLDDGRAAIGAYVIDTTQLSNGLHLIAWSVTDSAARTEGIGSRYFVVTNGVADPVGQDFGLSADALGALEALPPAASLRTGWDPGSAASMAPTVDRRIALDLAPLERMELQLPETLSDSEWTGYAVREGRLVAMPVGASLTSAGRFAWQAAPGFFGTHEFRFVRQTSNGARQVLPVRVTIAAPPVALQR